MDICISAGKGENKSVVHSLRQEEKWMNEFNLLNDEPPFVFKLLARNNAFHIHFVIRTKSQCQCNVVPLMLAFCCDKFISVSCTGFKGYQMT